MADDLDKANAPAEPGSEENEKKEPAVGFVHTPNIAEFFTNAQISLIVTTYQAGRILLLSPISREKLSMLMRLFPRPTGLAVDRNRLAVCCSNRIWFFRAVSELTGENGKPMPYDCVYVPLRSHFTGDIRAHQAVWQKDRLITINTRFNCICSLHPDWSFVPLWRPPFITDLAAEDRCHLNGFCMDAEGLLKFATVVSMTNSFDSWREHRVGGGAIMDIPTGEVVSSGLSMPHSPRFHAGKLWCLESGTGSLQEVDLKSGKRNTVAIFPGFTRGLAFYDRYAFVGLSQAREKKVFGNLPIEDRCPQMKCAVHVVDIVTGKLVGYLEFIKGIQELFDVEILIGPKAPHVIGVEDKALEQIMIVPPLRPDGKTGFSRLPE